MVWLSSMSFRRFVISDWFTLSTSELYCLPISPVVGS